MFTVIDKLILSNTFGYLLPQFEKLTQWLKIAAEDTALLLMPVEIPAGELEWLADARLR